VNFAANQYKHIQE